MNGSLHPLPFALDIQQPLFKIPFFLYFHLLSQLQCPLLPSIPSRSSSVSKRRRNTAISMSSATFVWSIQHLHHHLSPTSIRRRAKRDFDSHSHFRYEIFLLKGDFVLKLLHEHLKYCCCLGQHGLNTDTISETSTWILCIGFLWWWIYSSLIQHDYRASSVMNSLIMTTLVSRSLVYWSPCWRNSSCNRLNSCSFAATFALAVL